MTTILEVDGGAAEEKSVFSSRLVLLVGGAYVKLDKSECDHII